MKLEEIKDTYAKDKGYKDWSSLMAYYSIMESSNFAKLTLLEYHMDKICKIAQEHALKSINTEDEDFIYAHIIH